MFGFGKKQDEPLAISPPIQNEVVETVPVPEEPQKYELLPAEQVARPNGQVFSLHRIRALVDIPLHDVKAGDLGGYVYNSRVLSHEGSCWIGGDAMAAYSGRNDDYRRGRTGETVTGNALVTDNATVTGVISGDVKISGNAVVAIGLTGKSDISGDCQILDGKIYGSGSLIARGNVKIVSAVIALGRNSSVVLDGNIVVDNERKDDRFLDVLEGDAIEIKGDVSFSNVFIKGNLKVDAELNLESVTFKGNTTLLGKPQIKPNVTFTGRNFITGDSLIPPGSHVHDVRMTGGVLNYGFPVGASIPVPESTVSTLPEVPAVSFSESAAEAQEYVDLIEQIESDYEAYTTDIVKLIKYPAMVDASIPEVIDFISKLRSAKRAVVSSNTSRLKELAEALDTAFIRAENKVQTLVASHLDDGKKKALKTADQMFKLACNEASPDPEKKMGYKAGMKALEGVLVVSDKAVENMKERIGILELEV